MNRRAVAEIQRNIVKRRKRNAVSRLFNAKDDKEAIATWKLDLNRILHVFNVRSVVYLRPPLTVRLQTELALSTHVVVSDTRHGVVNAQTIISDVHQGVLDTQAIVSDIQRTIVKSQEVADGKSPSVSVTRTPLTTASTLTVVYAQNRSVISTNNESGVSHLHIACLVNPRPQRRGSVADATN